MRWVSERKFNTQKKERKKRAIEQIWSQQKNRKTKRVVTNFFRLYFLWWLNHLICLIPCSWSLICTFTFSSNSCTGPSNRHILIQQSILFGLIFVFLDHFSLITFECTCNFNWFLLFNEFNKKRERETGKKRQIIYYYVYNTAPSMHNNEIVWSFGCLIGTEDLLIKWKKNHMHTLFFYCLNFSN